MSVNARPNPLRVLADRKALWLAVPALALLGRPCHDRQLVGNAAEGRR